MVIFIIRILIIRRVKPFNSVTYSNVSVHILLQHEQKKSDIMILCKRNNK